LPCCMDSLLNQTLTDMEIILIDDGSSDNSPAMCDVYAQQYPVVKVIHKANEGVGIARNAGLEVAAGEYVTFVDSDDYVALNAYGKVYDIAFEKQADAVYFFHNHFYAPDKLLTLKRVHQETRYFDTKDSIRQYLLEMRGNLPHEAHDYNDVSGFVWGVLFRREIIDRHHIRFKDERLFAISEDKLFNVEFLLHAASVVNIPDALYYYRMHPDSICRTVMPDRIEKYHVFHRHFLEILKNNGFGNEGYLRATRIFIALSRTSIRQYVHAPLPVSQKMQWLQSVIRLPYWREIAASYPYRQLPWKYALHFHLLQKGCRRLLYLLSLR